MLLRRSLRVTALLAACAAPVLSHAQAPEEQGPPSGWGLGLGVGWQRTPYKGVENKTRVLPVVNFENRWVRVMGPGLDVKLPSLGPVSFAVRAKYALGDGFEADDSTYFSGMEERKASVWLGGAALWRTDFAKLSFEALGDASSHSKGTELKFGIEQDFRAGRFMFTPRVAAIWRDKKYIDYYYGVRPEEAIPGRPAYEGVATTNTEVGLRTAYLIDRQQGLFLDLSATAFGAGIKDSPLIERRGVPGVRLGYLYRF